MAGAQIHKGQLDSFAVYECKCQSEDKAVTDVPFPDPSCIQGKECEQGQSACHVKGQCESLGYKAILCGMAA